MPDTNAEVAFFIVLRSTSRTIRVEPRYLFKGGRERTLPLPDEVRTAIKEYLKLDAQRRQHLHSDGTDAYLFQPLVNYRTLEFAKPLSTRMVWNIVARWGN